ncbi:hypothetical protein AB0E08_08180 [Streptomyces sp. NPDC048281]|uniref:hypothetical protein n=1 Tax=Streptomyces sp. NPDC048281 TaxID=3154715 RepID=UPI003433DD77
MPLMPETNPTVPADMSLYKAVREGLRNRPGDQPLPTEGGESVQDALIQHILSHPRLGAGAHALAAKIGERRSLGIQRYGRPLQTFNGRDAVQDLMDELLDGATYAMQVKMEIDSFNTRIARALSRHTADETGQCRACKVPLPCETRQILTSKKQPPEPELKITKVEPVQEVVCSPDAVDEIRRRFGVTEAQTGIPNIGELMGFPVYVDDDLPPGTVRLQPSTPKQ